MAAWTGREAIHRRLKQHGFHQKSNSKVGLHVPNNVRGRCEKFHEQFTFILFIYCYIELWFSSKTTPTDLEVSENL